MAEADPLDRLALDLDDIVMARVPGDDLEQTLDVLDRPFQHLHNATVLEGDAAGDPERQIALPEPSEVMHEIGQRLTFGKSADVAEMQKGHRGL